MADITAHGLTHDATRPNIFQSAGQTVWATVERIAHRISDTRRLKRLLDMPDWTLADMGLTRADLYAALAHIKDCRASDCLEIARLRNLSRPLRPLRRRPARPHPSRTIRPRRALAAYQDWT